MDKVCFVNFNIYCLFNPASSAPMGGAELDLYTLAQCLSNYYKVSVITGDWGQKDIEQVEDISIYSSIKLSSKNYLTNFVKFWKKLKQTKADIYISSGAGIEVGVTALFTILYGKKYIYRTAHDMDCNHNYIKSHGIGGLLYKFGLERADQVVTSVKHHIKLLKIYHPSIISSQKINLAIKLPNKSNSKDKKYILWVARCETWKNPSLILRLSKQFPNEKFLMICPRQKHNTKFFDKIKRQSRKISNLTFINYVPFNKIQSYFNEAKIFVNTSDAEGFTYTLIQSGIAKTPVVYYRVNPDSAITRYRLGFCANGNLRKLTDGIQKLLEDPILWQNKSDAIYNYVIKHHDIAKICQQWRKIIQSLLKKHS